MDLSSLHSVLDLPELSSVPSSPPVGFVALYARDGVAYRLDAYGYETPLDQAEPGFPHTVRVADNVTVQPVETLTPEEKLLCASRVLPSGTYVVRGFFRTSGNASSIPKRIYVKRTSGVSYAVDAAISPGRKTARSLLFANADPNLSGFTGQGAAAGNVRIHEYYALLELSEATRLTFWLAVDAILSGDAVTVYVGSGVVIHKVS